MILKLPETPVPIVEIPWQKEAQLFVKREDLLHPGISGNKYWKLFYNVNNYLSKKPERPLLITFGGAYSNHIAAVAALAKDLSISALGIIRGEEIAAKFKDNPTLSQAHVDGMHFRFVSRSEYRAKALLTAALEKEFPHSLILPEGGTNALAVKGVQHMLENGTKSFDYLCTATGTGGTVAGISLYAEEHQRVLGFMAVKDSSLENTVKELSGRYNFQLEDASDGGYGRITDENIRFINAFYTTYGIPLDPVYTGKMMRRIFHLADEGFFPKDSRILAFHTGGLQGITGANRMLADEGRELLLI